MPFYTGSASSFSDLRTALFNACVAEGWTLSTDVLTKGSAAVKIENNTTSVTIKDLGLVLQGGTSATGATLVNPSPVTPRMGRASTATIQPTFPMEYYIHIFDSPDEVYLVAKSNVDYYYWLSFGLSDVPGLSSTGLWLSANANPRVGPGSSPGYAIGVSSGGINQYSGGFFWEDGQSAASSAQNQNTIASGLDSVIWSSDTASSGANSKFGINGLAASTLLSVQPNAWNSESTLVRAQVFQWRDANKCSMVADIKNARYVRIDNYSPEQIITLGSDQWRVYPYYRKNLSARDGGTGIEHTGTFGFAIRYDGP